MTNIVIDDMDEVMDRAPAGRFIPSKYQETIFEWIRDGSGDAIVNAVAGSGKTTTLVEASRLLSAGATGIFCAFNVHIVGELRRRLEGIDCKTIHSIGMAAVTKYLGEVQVDGNKYRVLVRKEAWALLETMPTLNRQEVISALSDLVDYCQTTLTSPDDVLSLSGLVSHFGLIIPCDLAKLAPSVARVLRQGVLQAEREHIISFSDMLWLPWEWELQPETYDWVFVDECQDLNRAQLEMVLKLRVKLRARSGRMIFVGDPRQAIYGFSGADARSYRNIQERTGATEFPLSVSYRCPVLVIREAQTIVPQIESRPRAPLGTVRWVSESKFFEEVQEGDLVLCRTTAPLISTCLELIRLKVPARVRGRDIGNMLTRFVKRVSEQPGFRYKEFSKHLHEEIDEQVKRLSVKEDNEGAIERLYDTGAALDACYVGLGSLDLTDFLEDIASLFSDDRPGVWLSTVHKAKGLENDRVFILRPDKLPLLWKRQQEWEREQEWNLKYVAITRAKEELVFVKTMGSLS